MVASSGEGASRNWVWVVSLALEHFFTCGAMRVIIGLIDCVLCVLRGLALWGIKC